MFFFFNDTATTEIYTLSLHDALPISAALGTLRMGDRITAINGDTVRTWDEIEDQLRSEEHTSELQSQSNLVCRLLLEKKKPQRMQPAEARYAPDQRTNHSGQLVALED